MKLTNSSKVDLQLSRSFFFANLFFKWVFIEHLPCSSKVLSAGMMGWKSFLPLCSIWSVDKEPFLHQNISKLVERGVTESNSGSLHLDMYTVIPFPPPKCVLPIMLYQQKQCFWHLPTENDNSPSFGISPFLKKLFSFLVFPWAENDMDFSLFLDDHSGLLFPSPTVASIWLCFHRPFLWSFGPSVPTSRAFLPPGQRWPFTSCWLPAAHKVVCSLVCTVSISSCRKCFTASIPPHPRSPLRVMGSQDLSHCRKWEGQETREGKGPPNWKDLLKLVPSFSSNPLFTIFSRASHIVQRDGRTLLCPALLLLRAVSLPRMHYPSSLPTSPQSHSSRPNSSF